MVKPFFAKIAANPKDFIITLENVICDKYETEPARNDQIKERVPKLVKELVGLFDGIKKVLLTDPSIDISIIFAFCSIHDNHFFVLPHFLYKIEYLRVEFDSFGRIKNWNESKNKYLWTSFFLLKIVTADLLANLFEVTGTKQKSPVKLAMRMVATVIYFSVYEAMKKNTKVYKTNDAILDEKPTTNESDVIDKDLNMNDWFKVKRSSEEVPAIRDVVELDLLKEAWNLKFIDEIATSVSKFADEIHAHFQPVFEKEKERQLAAEKAKYLTEKESKNDELHKSQFTSALPDSKKVISGIKTMLSMSESKVEDDNKTPRSPRDDD